VTVFTDFNRRLMARVHEEIRAVGVRAPMKAAWVHRSGRQWEFHGPHPETFAPNGFYWHGRAEDAYHARSKGWESWLQKRAEIKGEEKL